MEKFHTGGREGSLLRILGQKDPRWSRWQGARRQHQGPMPCPLARPAPQTLHRRCVSAPLVRATALPAPAAAGAEKKRRKVLREQTNTPVIMPAPTECSAPRIRGKARSRTNAPSVGAGQRMGHNLEKLSDAAECFAVEGMVTGELGRQH